jgi:hypothetical protein
MKAMTSLMAVILLILLVMLGAGAANLKYLFGVIIPYIAIILFIVGIVLRVLRWAGAPARFAMGRGAGSFPYSHDLRPAKIFALD